MFSASSRSKAQTFNSTMAFLLPWRSEWGTTSRSSFNATTAFLLHVIDVRPYPATLVFQCHHGVPASTPALPLSTPRALVSMPPRRSCFADVHLCFSLLPARFNATTAFLLPASSSSTIWRTPACFNATTAFLLPAGRPESGVPPGGFQCHHGVPASCSSPNVIRDRLQFQCHHGVPASLHLRLRVSLGYRFQCHHGVPASLSSSTALRQFCEFQCHHGVPASR